MRLELFAVYKQIPPFLPRFNRGVFHFEVLFLNTFNT